MAQNQLRTNAINLDTLDPVVDLDAIPVYQPVRKINTDHANPGSTSDLIGKLAQLSQGGNSGSTTKGSSVAFGGGGGTVVESTSQQMTLISQTTTSLSAGAISNISLQMAKSVAVLAVIVSSAARVRLYQTSAAMTADASRPNTVPPTPGSNHQVIGDWYLTGAANAPLTFWCSPIALGQNADGTTDATQNATIYAAVTNLGVSSAAITVQILYIPQES